MKTFLLTVAACGLLLTGTAKEPLYRDPTAPLAERVDDLLSRMTLREKLGQLSQPLYRSDDTTLDARITRGEVGSLVVAHGSALAPAERDRLQRIAVERSRLGIPVLFGFDVIHGYRTLFPIPLGIAASWNPELAEASARIAASEASACGIDLTFSPMVDVARDPRWGRISEGSGEDVLLNAVFGAALVRGYQGDDPSKQGRIGACVKHFVGYGAALGGRDYQFTELSERALRETYLPPFKACVDAGAVSVMSAFNDISGTPASANALTLDRILRKEWGFDGFVLSDWNAVTELQEHGIAADGAEAAVKALTAGVDMEMTSDLYLTTLEQSVREKRLPAALVDRAVRAVLRVKFRLGLFDRPFRSHPEPDRMLLTPEARRTARQLAAESMVLLKNDNQILPLTNKKKIAVVGPMAKNGWDLLGSWCGHGKDTDVEMLYDGLTAEFGGDAELRYAMGCKPQGNDRSGFAGALDVARWSDVVIVCLGEMLTWSGENASRSTIALPQIQEELVKELKEAGKPIILVLSNGRPLELNRMEPLCDAILEIWQPGINGARSMAGILSGRINPSGKLAMTFPYSTGQIPIYYNRRKSGRGHQGFYKDITSDPLYPFGHGLSYTEFKYGTVTPSATKVKRGDKLSAEVTVTNTGARDGAETVHWFISDPYCSITRPVKELKHFEKQFIKVGETKIFRFDIDLERDFGFVNEDGKRFLEAGEYHILVQGQTVKIELID